jgi:hypothetical protein
MYWFRPARNRKYPGDPLPRWAPLGRAGRPVLAVTVIASVVIALMISAARSDAAQAQSPSPSPVASGQRVEVPEAGIAITVPEGWGFRIEMLETDWVKAAGVTLDATIWRVLHWWNPDGDPDEAAEHCSIGLLRVGEQSVGMMTFGGAIRDPSPAPDQWPPGWTHSSAEILLPVGPATQIDVVIREPDGDWYDTTYNLVTPDGQVWLGCSGPERPDDRWLSIAETFEFLPSEEE